MKHALHQQDQTAQTRWGESVGFKKVLPAPVPPAGIHEALAELSRDDDEIPDTEKKTTKRMDTATGTNRKPVGGRQPDAQETTEAPTSKDWMGYEDWNFN